MEVHQLSIGTLQVVEPVPLRPCVPACLRPCVPASLRPCAPMRLTQQQLHPLVASPSLMLRASIIRPSSWLLSLPCKSTNTLLICRTGHPSPSRFYTIKMSNTVRPPLLLFLSYISQYIPVTLSTCFLSHSSIHAQHSHYTSHLYILFIHLIYTFLCSLLQTGKYHLLR